MSQFSVTMVQNGNLQNFPMLSLQYYYTAILLSLQTYLTAIFPLLRKGGKKKNLHVVYSTNYTKDNNENGN